MTKNSPNATRYDTALIVLLIILGAIRIISAIPWITNASHTLAVSPRLGESMSHPWASLFFQHFTPPLSFFVNSLVYSLGKPLSFYIMMGVALAAALIAAAYTYLSCRALNVRTSIAFVLTLGYALAMMRLRPALTWFANDELIYVFLPCFVWNVIAYASNPGKRHDLAMAILAGLMAWTSTVPGVVALMITAITVFSQKSTHTLRHRIGIVLIPFALMMLLCFKTYVNTGVFNICTKGGENGLQMVHNFTAGNLKEIYQYAKDKAHLPAWWQWCYTQGPTGQEMIYGQCFGPVAKWDFQPLHMALTAMGENKIARLVLEDMKDQNTRPWIFYAGNGPDISQRFIAQYNAQSQKVWTKFISEHPSMFTVAVINNTNKIFLYEGPLFIFNRDWENGLPIFGPLTKIIVGAMLPVFWGGAGAAYLLVIALLFMWGRISTLQLLALGFVFSNFIFIIATCCENARMFWLAAAYIIPLAAFLIETTITTSQASRK